MCPQLIDYRALDRLRREHATGGVAALELPSLQLCNDEPPGFVLTDLNGHHGTRTPEQGAAIAIKLATLPDDGPTGTYSDDTGPIAW